MICYYSSEGEGSYLRARSYLSGEVRDVIEKHREDSTSMTRRSEAGVRPSMRGESIRRSNVMWSNVMCTRSTREEGAIV